MNEALEIQPMQTAPRDGSIVWILFKGYASSVPDFVKARVVKSWVTDEFIPVEVDDADRRGHNDAAIPDELCLGWVSPGAMHDTGAGECRACRHWQAPEGPHVAGFGACMRAATRALQPLDDASPALAIDVHGVSALLQTKPNFGCNQWAPLEASIEG